MNLELFGYTLTPERLRVVAIGLCVLLLGYLAYVGPYPELQTYLDKRDQIQQLQQEADAGANIPFTRNELLAKRSEVLAELAALRGKFPPRSQILSILLLDLSHIFRASGIQLVSFEPSGFKPLEEGGMKDLGRMRIKITAKGDYSSFITLFDKLAHYDRVLRVEGPDISPLATTPDDAAPGGGAASGFLTGRFARMLSVNFTLTTFAMDN